MFETTLHNLINREDLTLLFVVKFGSHLYGTDTPASDEDYKGVYLPTRRDLLLNRVGKSLVYDTNRTATKNTEDDVDFEVYSLHYFFELAKKGETVAIDMLHANEANVVYTTPLWDEVVKHRSMFYTRNMKALVGYARKQAAKYGEKGSRLNAAQTLKHFLEASDPDSRMSEHWNNLPTGEHLKHLALSHPKGIRSYSFCGKQIQDTVKVSYVLDMVKAFDDQYGHRAKKAQADGGVDWKAVSHALRAAYQLREIYETGDLKFPLTHREYVRDVKAGVLPFDDVLKVLEANLDAVEALSTMVALPDNVDKNAADELLLSLLEKEYA